MPRSLQPDKKLFGVTLALCLIGAVMVFSASAMTAQRTIRRGLHFPAAPADLCRAGNRRNVLPDEHGLSQAAPAARGIHRSCGHVCAAGLRIFPGPLAPDSSLVPHGPLQLSAVGNGQARADRLSRVAARVAAPAQKFRRERSAAHFGSRDGRHSDDGRAGGERAGHGHRVHDHGDRRRYAFCRRTFAEIHRRHGAGRHSRRFIF